MKDEQPSTGSTDSNWSEADAEDNCVQGQEAYEHGDLTRAIDCWTEALALCDGSGYTCGTVNASTAGARRAHLLTNLGVAHHERGDSDYGEDCLLDALACYAGLDSDAIDPIEKVGCVADVKVNLALTWNALGHPLEAETLLREAIAEYQPLIAGGHEQWQVRQALANANLGTLMVDRYWIDEGEQHLKAALEVLCHAVSQGMDKVAVHCEAIRSIIGSARWRSERAKDAREIFHEVHAALMRLPAVLGSPRSTVVVSRNLMKLAALDPQFLRQQGVSDPKEMLHNLVDAGQAQWLHDLAWACFARQFYVASRKEQLDDIAEGIEHLRQMVGRWGTIHVRDLSLLYVSLAGNLRAGWAVRSALRAAVVAQRLVDIMPPTFGFQFEIARAIVSNFVGCMLGENRRLRNAADFHLQAVDMLLAARRNTSHPQRFERTAAHWLCNVGFVSLVRRDVPSLLSLYARLAHEFDFNSEGGYRGQTSWSIVRVEMFRAGALIEFGREEEALNAFSRAFDKVFEHSLDQTFGYDPVLPFHLAGMVLHSVWFGSLDHGASDLRIDELMPKRLHLAGLAVKLLHQSREMTSYGGFDRLKQAMPSVIACTRIATDRIPEPKLQWQGIREEVTDLSLRSIGTWLRSAAPDDIENCRPILEFALEAHLRVVSMLGVAGLCGQWFLFSQGLRSQRPEREQLRSDDLDVIWKEIDEIDRQRLARMDKMGGLLAPSATELDSVDVKRRADLMRQYLQSRPALPVPALDISAVEGSITPGHALLFLARNEVGLLLVVLAQELNGRRHLAQHQLRLSAVASIDVREDLALWGTQQRASTRGGVRCAPGVIGRANLTHVPDCQATPLEVQGLNSPSILGGDLLAPLLQLAEPVANIIADLHESITQIALVPSGDLYLLPWHHLFHSRSGLGRNLRVFTAVAHWLSTAEHAPSPSAGRLAVIAYDAADSGDLSDRLVWVPVEATLTRAVWGSAHAHAWQPGQDAPDCDQLLACGHGDYSNGIWDEAGVWVGMLAGRPGGHSKRDILTARDLGRFGKLRRMMLSTCVLGRTEAVYGEPLGLVAHALGQGVQFAVGSLVEIGDLEATLFGAALQWSLQQSQRDAASAIDCSKVFAQTQFTLHRKRWPSGFGAWLAPQLEEALELTIPSAEAARADVRQRELRQAWFEALSNLSLDLSIAPPARPSVEFGPFVKAISRALAEAPTSGVAFAAAGMVAYGF